jgi:SWI/SNF-related matrix-associated actin-dependent regulator of chromatin subfamily A3
MDQYTILPHDNRTLSDSQCNKRRKLNNWDSQQPFIAPCLHGSANQHEASIVPSNAYEQDYSAWCNPDYGTVAQYIHTQSTQPANRLSQPNQVWDIEQTSNYTLRDIRTCESNLHGCEGTPSSAAQINISIEMAVCATGIDANPSDFLDADCDLDQECTTSILSMTICYGMLCDIQVEILVPLQSLMEYQALCWDGATALLHPTDGFQVAKLLSITVQVLRTLSSEACVEFQFWLSPQQQFGDQQNHRTEELAGKGAVLSDRRLSVILYGSNNMATHVGEWLDDMKMYLQIPGGCDRDVPYMNPHCLASYQESTVYTSELPSDLSVNGLKGQEPHSDAFPDLYCNSVFELAPQPRAIASTLHTHQRQALTFMIERENGWNLSGTQNDIWKSYIDAFGDMRYKNTVSGLTQAQPPENFQGGIIADEMGLGKTCTMLALIAANPFQPGLYPCSSASVKGTLIVVPFPLLFVWEKQIQEHFRCDQVRHAIFYGRDRQQNANLQDYDIVVTTYTTVALEWKNHKAPLSQTSSSLLFSIFWHRIILDEAHVIRSKETICAKSIYALQAERRWCITGTPIQNRLIDIFSLLRFLRVRPYDDLQTFQEQILRPWKSKMDEAALKRLQSIMKAIAIRRTKSIISLPDRIEHTEEICFTDEERSIYATARMGVIEVLDNAMCIDQSTSGSVYLNALQRINDLRYICNHGVSPPRRRENTNSMNSFDPVSCALIDERLETWAECMDTLCIHCGAELLEYEEDNNQLLVVPESGLNHLPSRTCKSCPQRDRLSLSPSASNLASGFSTPPRRRILMQPSSKIKALVGHIQQLPLDDKCVVFSYWTSSLDAVEEVLKQAQIRFCRYDGQLSRSKRSQVLKEFTNDASLRVFLVSITCGGQGLDLTAANQAYLLEPQWNPMLEEQAMARVHRIGQKKVVRLVRLLMKDTFEENIVRLQGRKRTLADLIVDRSPLKEGTDGKKQLYYLRELVE